MKRIFNITLMLTSSTLLFTACTSATANLPSNANTPSFVQGKADGCSTATGEYTKNSNAFKVNGDYKDGWFYGRKTCNPSQSK